MILPVATTLLALPTEVPVTRASSETSSSLRDSAATPKAASLSARGRRPPSARAPARP